MKGKCINYIEISFTKPLAQSLWSFDEEQLTILIHGIEDILDIDSLKIEQIIQDQNSVFYQSGNQQAESVISHHFDLYYEDNLIGKLAVSASLNKIYNQLLKKSSLILFIQFLKTIIVSACVLLVMYYFLIRHLNFIVNYLRNTSIVSGKLPELRLPGRDSYQSDELDELASSFNSLYQQVSTTLIEREKFTELLQDERDFSDTVIETMSSLLVCTDKNVVIQRFNIAVEQLLMLQGEQIKWQQLFTIIEETDKLSEALYLGKLTKEGVVKSKNSRWRD